MTDSAFRVGDLVVTPRRCMIERASKAVRVKPKSMAVLVRLAAADGQVVTRNELFESVWPNSAVTDDALTQCIVELRKALGDSAQDPIYIETVPKIGFRLAPPVTRIDDGFVPQTNRWKYVAVAALAGIALLTFTYGVWQERGEPIRSVAVLPLANLSDEPGQASLAYGMTDLLTAELGQIAGLGVISRTSSDLFRDSDKTLPQIARELGADALIEGSVQHAEHEVRITLQLIDGRTDRHLWSRDYRRNLQDILTLQGEVAREIADEIAIALSPQLQARMQRDREGHPEAVRLWIEGTHMLKNPGEPDRMEQALKYFAEAVARDPDFAPAYASMATAYVFQGSWLGRENPNVVLPLAISAGHRALELDPYLADAHFALGQIHWLNWQWEAAEREYLRGRELNPSDSSGLVGYTNFLTAMGRYDEAVEIGMQAVRLDPFSPLTYNELAFAYWSAGRLDKAMEWFDKSLQLDPDFHQTVLLIPELYLQLGQPDLALEYLERIQDKLDELLSQDLGYAAATYVNLGREDKARELLEYLQERMQTEPVRAFAFVLIYNALGEHDKALDWLERAVDERETSLIWLKEDYAFDGLRQYPRFDDILSRVQFTD